MRGTFCIMFFSLSPIIEEKIVQQAATGCCLIVQAQRLAYPKREVGYTPGMVVDMIGMMTELFELEKFFVLKDVLDQQGVLGPQKLGCRPLDGIGEEQGKKREKQQQQFDGEQVEKVCYAEKPGCIEGGKKS